MFMNRFFLILWALFLTMSVQAQFVNYGATITIQPGATLRIETSFENQAGTIDNQGTLEVLGNFTNAAGAGTTLSGNGTVKFIGDANSDVITNGDALQNVEMAKTTSNGKVTLMSNTTINGDLLFSGTGNNKIELGNFDLSLHDTSMVTATTNHTTNGYVVTNGTGKLVKPVSASAPAVVMQIGDASNYAPLQLTMTGNAAGNVSARTVVPPVTPKYNDADAYINREWVVSTPTITSTSLQGTYVNGDAVGTASNIKGCSYQGSGEWNFAGFAGAANSVTATTTNNTDVILSGQNFFGKANLKVFLQGPYNTTTGLMNTTLNSSGILQANATTSPYLDAPASVGAGFFAANPTIVDWIKLEFRDPSTPSVSTSNKISAFLKSDGTIVAKDGGSLLPRLKDCPYTNNAVIVISHRNHLPIRTVNSGLHVVDVSSRHDFNTGYDKAFELSSAINNNYSMNYISGIFSNYIMWAGNSSGDHQIKYAASSNDILPISQKVLNDPGNIINSASYVVNGYHNQDTNMNGGVKYAGSNNDVLIISQNVLNNSKNLIQSASFPILKHVE
jgi:hypothetical protein